MPSGGCNLSFVQWFRDTHYFTDLMLQARRPWIHAGATPSDDLAPVNYGPGWRSDGYPVSVTSSQMVTYVFAANDYPTGQYKIYFDGRGTVRCQQFSSPQTYESTQNTQGATDTLVGFNVSTADTTRLMVTIVESAFSDPVRNIRCIVPGHDVSVVRNKNHPNYNPFNPDFLSHLGKYSVIRFMDWFRTNESTQEDFEGRTSPEWYSWGTEYSQTRPWSTPGLTTGQYARVFPGAPWEAAILLGKLTGKDIWICVPWKLDDAGIQSMATIFRNEFPASQKIYLELGNEPWNTAFDQGREYRDNNAAMAYERGLPTPSSNYVGRQMLQAYDSINAWNIWESIFGAEFSTRVVKVLNSQATSSDWTSDTLGGNGFGRTDVNPNLSTFPDAVAVAPYIGSQFIRQWSDERRNSPSDPDNPGQGEDAETARAWLAANRGRDYMLSEINTRISEFVTTNVFDHLNKAKRFDGAQLDVIAYEGGQHYVLKPNYLTEDSDFKDAVFNVYRHPDMYQVYRNYFDAWEAVNPGALFCPYNECQDYEDSGGWGTLEHRYQTSASAHRDRAVDDWLGEVANPGTTVPSGAADTPLVTDLAQRTNTSPYQDDEPPPDSGGGETGGGTSDLQQKTFLGVV